jgi:hypothetical protein
LLSLEHHPGRHPHLLGLVEHALDPTDAAHQDRVRPDHLVEPVHLLVDDLPEVVRDDEDADVEVVVGADAAHEEGRREARKRVKLDLTT